MRSGLAGRERRQAQDVRTDHSPNWTDRGRTTVPWLVAAGVLCAAPRNGIAAAFRPRHLLRTLHSAVTPYGSDTLAANRMGTSMRLGAWPTAAAFLLLIGVTGLVSLRKDLLSPVKVTLANAIYSIDLNKAGPILNDYDFGGYFDVVGIPPFIDGRAELYGQTYILRYDSALSLRNLPDFLRLLEEYRIGATLRSRRRPSPCSIGCRIGNASMPMTSPSCTCAR